MSILEDIRAFVPGCEQEQRDREAMLEFLAVMCAVRFVRRKASS